MALSLDQFVNKNNGKFVDVDGYPKDNPFQCVDLDRVWIRDGMGWPQSAMPGAATAKLIFQNFKDNQYYKKVLNTPTNVPLKGDLIFWGFYPFVTGWAGHTAIFSQGDVKSFISFDQNYPTKSFCKYVNHSYRGVMGWLTPVKK